MRYSAPKDCPDSEDTIEIPVVDNQPTLFDSAPAGPPGSRSIKNSPAFCEVTADDASVPPMPPTTHTDPPSFEAANLNPETAAQLDPSRGVVSTDVTAEANPAISTAEGQPTVATSTRVPVPTNRKHQKRSIADKKLRRQQEQKEAKADSQLLYRELDNPTLIEVSPNSIQLEGSLLEELTRKFVGLFKINLQNLKDDGARCLTDLLTIHVKEKKKDLVCVGGYFALSVVKALTPPPDKITVRLHKEKVDDEQIKQWAHVEFLCVPVLFWLAQEEEKHQLSGGKPFYDSANLFESTGRNKRTGRADEFYRLFLEFCDSEIGKQLVRRPKNEKELAEILRVSLRTITNRSRNTK